MHRMHGQGLFQKGSPAVHIKYAGILCKKFNFNFCSSYVFINIGHEVQNDDFAYLCGFSVC
jgi:hypothetical protein